MVAIVSISAISFVYIWDVQFLEDSSSVSSLLSPPLESSLQSVGGKRETRVTREGSEWPELAFYRSPHLPFRGCRWLELLGHLPEVAQPGHLWIPFWNQPPDCQWFLLPGSALRCLLWHPNCWWGGSVGREILPVCLVYVVLKNHSLCGEGMSGDVLAFAGRGNGSELVSLRLWLIT